MILCPKAADDALATAASAIDGVRYLPRSEWGPDSETLLDRVRDAARAFERRRFARRDADLLDALLESVPYELYLKDREGRYVRASDSIRNDFSREPIGQTEVDAVREGARSYARDALEADLRVVETGEPIVERTETLFREVEDEPTKHRQTTRLPWTDEDGTVIGLIGIRIGVTESVRREREYQRTQRRLERLSEFVAHDLRNPLNLARGYLELAIDTGDDDALTEALAGLDRLESEIDRLLSSTRTGFESPTFSSVTLAEVIEDAWSGLEDPAGTLRTEIPASAVVRADRDQLRTFLERLFENAIKTAGPDATVAADSTERGFVVDDDGPGLPEDERETLLEYGYTTAGGGTSVGLATVARIADGHGWSVSVEESPLGGTRFAVSDCMLVTAPQYELPGDGRAVELSVGRDLGDATPAGSSRYVPERDEWIVRGGGANVWRHTDECHFRYATVDGDARIVGQVTDFDPVIDYSKAHLAVRSAPESGSAIGAIGLTAGAESEVLWRETPDRPIVTR